MTDLKKQNREGVVDSGSTKSNGVFYGKKLITVCHVDIPRDLQHVVKRVLNISRFVHVNIYALGFFFFFIFARVHI